MIVSRKIVKGHKANEWKINGKKSGTEEVRNRVRKLNIQVDNLCQFLPQDKVVSFAQLSTQELLRETEKATGKAELLNWHDKLIDIRKEEKAITSVGFFIDSRMFHDQDSHRLLKFFLFSRKQQMRKVCWKI